MHAQLAAASAAPQLQVKAVHLWRGDKHLLRGVSLTLDGGELLQVTGPNGVGKTSLLRCIAGLLPMESGEVQWRGRSLRQAQDEFHRDLAYLAHVNALKPDLTALENLHYSVALRRSVERRELVETLSRLKIEACADLPARSLSAGQKRRVSLARIMLSQASFWILDEPITNLDVAGIALFESCMEEHLSRGGLVLTAAHQLLLQGHVNVRTLELS
jgi:heme exporter protein A